MNNQQQNLLLNILTRAKREADGRLYIYQTLKNNDVNTDLTEEERETFQRIIDACGDEFLLYGSGYKDYIIYWHGISKLVECIIELLSRSDIKTCDPLIKKLRIGYANDPTGMTIEKFRIQKPLV